MLSRWAYILPMSPIPITPMEALSLESPILCRLLCCLSVCFCSAGHCAQSTSKAGCQTVRNFRAFNGALSPPPGPTPPPRSAGPNEHVTCTLAWGSRGQSQRAPGLGHTQRAGGESIEDFLNSALLLLLSSPYSIRPSSTVAMAPPKKTAPATKENVTLGPLAGDGA